MVGLDVKSLSLSSLLFVPGAQVLRNLHPQIPSVNLVARLPPVISLSNAGKKGKTIPKHIMHVN